MGKTYSIRGLDMYVEQFVNPEKPAIVFLHGFTGSSSTWRDAMNTLKDDFSVFAVDLTGHGKTSTPLEADRYSMSEQVADLDDLFSKLQLSRFIFVGYSMGGRLAIGYTARHPEKIAALLLESSSPGLQKEEERIARQASDAGLAERLLQNGIETFVNNWENIPLFESQKMLSADKRKAIREERMSQSPTGLANSLRGFGTGSQPSYWEILRELQMPVLLMTGELDSKFVAIAREMKKDLPKATQIIVPQAGHAIHVEKPELFVTIVKEYLEGLTY
ncbi:putative 2-succinyl-6-hydroxy-2,4-cyclohexadiene-1-carboxylate synthase [Sporosarcina sp. NCCP-2222]|uniref:2-succinyl-6-hydroxy-2, 4-cyclohexadiene-1-carboxylate synthase n=1 Tax=Sporosarcina sp. NCCP-2222 TaxID=2935073 RepID=UPI00208B851A|nr:2-succinyl-6-hydroxy-2,4-cyclohexadiene-1-carboxylate synthase [Sporosarcina sp. NCCP-2222]GKV55913.1 putative 2-succinyl-6-hydroxy-2,4-cyclohexadiene-1-carboxylate synthase [Sporosarcina sp. NCCP-2222]